MITSLQSKPDIDIDVYTIRPATWDDLEGVSDLLNAWSMNYLGIHKFRLDDQRREWQTPKFNLQESTRVAVTPDGQIVGYYEIWDLVYPPVRVHVWGRIHPDHEGRGLGTRLLDWGIQTARRALQVAPAEAKVTLGIQVLNTHADAHRLFENHSFRLSRHFLQMVIDLDGTPVEADWPDGIEVRSMVRGQDERKIIQAFCDSFQDHWGHVEAPFEDTYNRWMNFIDDNPDFDPALWFIAEENGNIAGISLCWEKSFSDPKMGWVGTLGVLRPWRRRGLGLALLRHSFARLYERGQRKIGLGVDAQSLTGATRLYEKAGMRSDPRYQVSFFELELRPGIDLTTQEVEG
jgi:mycothiol synthase